jgi:hypothetical protein
LGIMHTPACAAMARGRLVLMLVLREYPNRRTLQHAPTRSNTLHQATPSPVAYWYGRVAGTLPCVTVWVPADVSPADERCPLAVPDAGLRTPHVGAATEAVWSVDTWPDVQSAAGVCQV